MPFIKINKFVLLGIAGLIAGGPILSNVTDQPLVTNVTHASTTQINKRINRSLTQCHDWAAGRIDKNGKKTDHGTANLAYQWSTYITSIHYEGNQKLTINVNNNFDDLQDKAKRDALNSAENCANQVLLEQKKITADDANKGLKITVRDGHGVVGHSGKMSNRLYDFN